jgi:long-subunit fatty acid transport protein
MNRSFLTISVLLAINFSANAIERIDIPSTFNPVGSGARSLGMGGAFIAMADDATAASWNPSALIQLRKPELAVAFSYTKLTEEISFGTNPEANGSNSVSNSDLNYLAASYPCSADVCGKNMVFSVNYQRQYDFSRSWDASFDEVETVVNRKQEQTGSLFTAGLAYAIQVTPDLSLGFTLNFWEDFIGDNQTVGSTEEIETGTIIGDRYETKTSEKQVSDFSGFNYNLGILWEVFQSNESKLTLGAVYKSAFDADVTKDVFFSQAFNFPDQPELNGIVEFESVGANATLSFPASFGVGLAYQVSDNLTVAADIYQTMWSDFIFTDEAGNKFSPISSRPTSQANIEDTTQIRLGMEYRIISQSISSNYIIPLRAGIFIDPAPGDGDGKAENIYGLALGGGISYDNWVFDIAYQYRWGDDIGKNAIPAVEFSQNITEHQVIGSVFYRF